MCSLPAGVNTTFPGDLETGGGTIHLSDKYSSTRRQPSQIITPVSDLKTEPPQPHRAVDLEVSPKRRPFELRRYPTTATCDVGGPHLIPKRFRTLAEG